MRTEIDSSSRYQAQGESSAGAAAISSGAPVLKMFEKNALRRPQAIAVRAGNEAFTYRQLDDDSRCVAQWLGRSAIGLERRVAVLLRRSYALVASILGILRAGAAYVPLDPAYPPERLHNILSDVGAEAAITDATTCKLLGRESSCRQLRFDEADWRIGQNGSGVKVEISPENLAYVIYTSGSTGRPKGIGISHGAIGNYARGATVALDLPSGASYAMVSTVAADLGNTMLYPALCNGGTLHMVDESHSSDPERWSEYCRQHGIDCLKIVPTHLELLLSGSNPADAIPRQRLVLGGEACSWELIQQVQRLAGECRIYNHYGPTETTVGVLAGLLAPLAEGDRPAAPPLGRPFADSLCFVLDSNFNPAQPGTVGELHIGGKGLARGYFDKPALTAESFCPDPFSGRSGARLYRTGDLVQILPDGRIEFIGRNDHQIKVRGHRVEMEEIERALASHDDVRAVKVLAMTHNSQKRCVAFVASRAEKESIVSSLRELVRSKLPDYCMPSSIIVMDHFPITPNGKIDLSRLREIHEQDRCSPAPGPGLLSGVQKELIEIWQNLLGTRNIGLTDNFFESGGNSFLAVRLMARIQKRFGRRLPLATLIAAGTIEKMAALLSSETPPAEPGYLVTLQKGGHLTPFYCIHPGHGGVLCYTDLARHLGPDRPVYGLQSLDLDYGQDPYVSIEEMARRYVKAISTVQDPGSKLILLGWSFGGAVAFEMARLLPELGIEVELVFLDCRLPVTASTVVGVDRRLLRASILFEHLAGVSESKFSLAELRHLPLHDQLRLVAERTGIEVEDLVPKDMGYSGLERYLEMRSARIQALEKYEFRPQAVDATLFRAEDLGQPVLIPELGRAFKKAAQTPDYGWGQLCLGALRILSIPCTHDSILAEPYVQQVARELTAFGQPARPTSLLARA